MSQDEQDMVAGRVMREHGEAEKKLVLLKAEAHKVGEFFIQLGTQFKTSPQLIRLVKDGEPLTPGVQPSKIPSVDTLQKLVDDIRTTTVLERTLHEQAKQLGMEK